MARESVSSGSVRVEGLRETNKALQSLGADRKEIQNANFEAAETLIKAARPLVPVRTGALVGTLKASRSMNYAAARAGLARVPYANPIHWGWSIVGDSHKGVLSPGTIRNIRPQPFFSEALGYTKDEIIANYERDMQQLSNKYGFGAN
jgi:hypothetical protein